MSKKKNEKAETSEVVREAEQTEQAADEPPAGPPAVVSMHTHKPILERGVAITDWIVGETGTNQHGPSIPLLVSLEMTDNGVMVTYKSKKLGVVDERLRRALVPFSNITEVRFEAQAAAEGE